MQNLTVAATTTESIFKQHWYNVACPVVLLLCIACVAINAFILIISSRSRLVNKTPSLLISLNLSTTDFVTSILNGFDIIIFAWFRTSIQVSPCQTLLYQILRFSGTLASALHLLVLAIVHYGGIKHPLHYRSSVFQYKRAVNIMSIVCWLVSIAMWTGVFYFHKAISFPIYKFEQLGDSTSLNSTTTTTTTTEISTQLIDSTQKNAAPMFECDLQLFVEFKFAATRAMLFAIPLIAMSIIYGRIYWIVSNLHKVPSKSSKAKPVAYGGGSGVASRPAAGTTTTDSQGMLSMVNMKSKCSNSDNNNDGSKSLEPSQSCHVETAQKLNSVCSNNKNNNVVEVQCHSIKINGDNVDDNDDDDDDEVVGDVNKRLLGDKDKDQSVVKVPEFSGKQLVTFSKEQGSVELEPKWLDGGQFEIRVADNNTASDNQHKSSEILATSDQEKPAASTGTSQDKTNETLTGVSSPKSPIDAANKRKFFGSRPLGAASLADCGVGEAQSCRNVDDESQQAKQQTPGRKRTLLSAIGKSETISVVSSKFLSGRAALSSTNQTLRRKLLAASGSVNSASNNDNNKTSVKSELSSNGNTNTNISVSQLRPLESFDGSVKIAQTQSNTKAFKTTMLILMTYIIFYAPSVTYNLLTCLDSDYCLTPVDKIPENYRLFFGTTATTFLVLKSLIDPLIYSLRSVEIQDAIRRAFPNKRRNARGGKPGSSAKFNSSMNTNYSLRNPTSSSNHHHHHHKYHNNNRSHNNKPNASNSVSLSNNHHNSNNNNFNSSSKHSTTTATTVRLREI